MRQRLTDMKTNVLLSIEKPDEYFDELVWRVGEVANVATVGLNDIDLTDVDVFVGKRLLPEQLVTANRLKAVFTYKTGVDEFDLDGLAQKGVTLCNSHVNSDCIAQYAFALAAALTSRVAEFDKKLRCGDWSADVCWRSIFDMKVGLVGYGSIGKEVHKLLSANGIAAFTIDRGKRYEGVTTVPTLRDLCRVCDLLIISLPKTPQTDNLFDESIFALLRGKYIVNVGRGNCIDEQALFRALRDGQLAGAAIDAWRRRGRSGSEMPSDQPFEVLDNVLLSPHKAMQIADGHARYVRDVTENLLSYLAGNPPQNVVDLKKGY